MTEPSREIAPAKLNLAIHVRGKLPDGRHRIETIYAFCTDGDHLSAVEADELSIEVGGQFARELPESGDNLALKAARALRDASGTTKGAAIALDKRLPTASGTPGADAGTP